MTTRTVSNSQELLAALTSAKGGDVILLKPGNYGDIWISDKSYTANVTIASANASARAVIETMTVQNAENITFKDIDFGRALTKGEARHTPMVNVLKSENLVFDDVEVHGSLDGNPGNDGYGMSIRDSGGIDVINSEFQQLRRGAVFTRVNDINVIGNQFHDIRSDGMDFVQVRGVVIDGNLLTDFYPAGSDHADAIQFLTAGTKVASSDIRITNNVILEGKGSPAQGIFLKDETQTLPYTDVLIANNLVYMNTYNGITVARGSGIEIIGNTVLSENTDNIKARIWLNAVDGARVEDNVSDIILQDNSSRVTRLDNLTVYDGGSSVPKLPNVNAGAAAVVADLVLSGAGYQPNGDLPASSPSSPAPLPPAIVRDSPVSDAIASALGKYVGTVKAAKVESVALAAAPEAGDLKITSPEDGAAILKGFVVASLAEQAPASPSPVDLADPGGLAAVATHAFGFDGFEHHVSAPLFRDVIGQLFGSSDLILP